MNAPTVPQPGATVTAPALDWGFWNRVRTEMKAHHSLPAAVTLAHSLGTPEVGLVEISDGWVTLTQDGRKRSYPACAVLCVEWIPVGVKSNEGGLYFCSKGGN